MPHPPVSRVRWTILALILFASFISYMVRSNLSVLADFMGEDLGLSATQLGYFFSAFAAGYALFQLPGGALGNRYGGRWLVTMMAIAWFVLTALTAMVSAQSFWATGTIVLSLVVLRFLVGVTNAPIFPVTAGGTIANWFPIGGWGLPMGLQVAALSLGAALSAPLLVWLAEEYGWRGALLTTAPASLVLAVVWWRYVRDFPKDHDGVSEGELALIDANRPPPEDRPMPGAWKVAQISGAIYNLLRNTAILPSPPQPAEHPESPGYPEEPTSTFLSDFVNKKRLTPLFWYKRITGRFSMNYNKEITRLKKIRWRRTKFGALWGGVGSLILTGGSFWGTIGGIAIGALLLYSLYSQPIVDLDEESKIK